MAISSTQIDTVLIVFQDSPTEGLDILGVCVAEVEAVERGRHLEGAQRRAVELGAGLPGNPTARTSEGIHVHQFPPLPRRALGAHRRPENPPVSPQGCELLLGPPAT